MKKLSRIKTVFVLLLLLGGVSVYHGWSARTYAASDLLLENVEALARGEVESTYCFGDGTVTCPLGGKAEYVLEGVR